MRQWVPHVGFWLMVMFATAIAWVGQQSIADVFFTSSSVPKVFTAPGLPVLGIVVLVMVVTWVVVGRRRPLWGGLQAGIVGAAWLVLSPSVAMTFDGRIWSGPFPIVATKTRVYLEDDVVDVHRCGCWHVCVASGGATTPPVRLFVGPLAGRITKGIARR